MSDSGIELRTLKKTEDPESPPDYSSLTPTAEGVNSNGEAGAHTNKAYLADSEEKLDQQAKEITEVTQDDDDDQYEEDSDDDDDDEYTGCNKYVAKARNVLVGFYDRNTKAIWFIITIMFIALYFVYFGFAMEKTFDVHDEASMRLMIVTAVVVLFSLLSLLSSRICPSGMKIRLFDEDCDDPAILKTRSVLYWLLVAACALFIIAWVVVDVALNRPRNLISALGMFVFILTFYLFSHKPHKVNWRPVFWGIVIQFFFALLILRSDFGYKAFEWLGERVQEFLLHTDEGSKFLFGEEYTHHNFAFKVLPVIVFFSSAVSVLYYWGVMQFIIRHIARFLAFCLGTSPAESLNAAGNIFIGQTESPLMIRPFLKDMTKSELHAICTGGFATIAGSVMAAYISLDVPANHLLSASVMSAPAALAMSKLFWPQSNKVKSNAKDVYNIKKGTEHNFVEAASKGASIAISLIANIAVNLIAFIALLHFVDQTLTWLGHRVGLVEPDHRELSFRMICRYVFFPVAWLMGVTDVDDTLKVASLIGSKTFLNEFYAYSELSVFIKNTAKYNIYMQNNTGFYNGTYYDGDDLVLNGLDNATILVGGIMQERSVMISTYALCGFSNVSSIGIMLGGLGAMAPSRRRDLTKVVVRAMIAGNVACFMTASIAGLLYHN